MFVAWVYSFINDVVVMTSLSIVNCDAGIEQYRICCAVRYSYTYRRCVFYTHKHLIGMHGVVLKERQTTECIGKKRKKTYNSKT